MNDTAQNQQQQATSDKQQVTVDQNQTSQQAPVSPVSAPNREHEPAPFPDVSKMTEAEIQKEEKEVEKELEAIVEKSPKDQSPKVDEELKRIGVELTDEARVEPTFSVGEQALPMSFAQARATRQKYKWRNSISWLAALVMYHWKKLQH